MEFHNGGLLPTSLASVGQGTASTKARQQSSSLHCVHQQQLASLQGQRVEGSAIYMSIRKPAPAGPPPCLASYSRVLFPLIQGAQSRRLPASIWQTPRSEYISDRPAGFSHCPGSHTGELCALDRNHGHTQFQEPWAGRGKDAKDFRGLD